MQAQDCYSLMLSKDPQCRPQTAIIWFSTDCVMKEFIKPMILIRVRHCDAARLSCYLRCYLICLISKYLVQVSTILHF